MPTPTIDQELAALHAGKTSATCAKIVALYGPLVKSACRRVLRDDGLAEDAAQETFVLLMKKAKSLPPSTSLAGWLYHAACRTALNHQRTAMRRRVRENSVEAMNQMIPDTQPNLWTEIEPHLDDAMLALPERQRDLVVQCYFQNQSQRSAAAALGCSESVVSRELSAAIEGLRQFITKRRVVVSSVALTGLLSTHAASASMTGSAVMVSAMMSATTSASLMAALIQSKLVLAAVAVVGTATVATVGYQQMTSPTRPATSQAVKPNNAVSSVNTSINVTFSDHKSAAGNASWRGKWDASFRFTSAMALNERKKQVLLESDPDLRYALLQKMGVLLSRAAFDDLIAKDLDASVAPWRDPFAVLANRTEMFDHYLMAWSNEDPLAALNWVTAQPDGGLGMRKQLLYALEARQLQPETLREWINSLTVKSMQEEAIIALESIGNPSSLIARMGTGGNEGFLVDLAMLNNGQGLDWTAFGAKLAAGKSAIVARAMRLVLKGDIAKPQLDQMIRQLAQSPDVNIRVGAPAILRAARGDAGVDYPHALQLAAMCDQAGMSNFSSSIFQGWAVADPSAAMQYAGGLRDLASMREVIAALPTLPDEATMLSWMTGTPTKAQDIALSALYGRSTNGPFDQLQKIMESTSIMDQVEAALEVMRMVPLSQAPAAAEWIKQLPESEDRQLLSRALTRRLATVDPQATLELVQSSGLQGQDYEETLTQAVTQFAAQNDLAKSTQFIKQITDPQMHDKALGQLAMVKFPGHPQDAYAYLQTHAQLDWQASALRMLSDLYYNKLGNIDANAAEILKLDLPRLGPDVALRASKLCKIWVDHQVPLNVPLTWTQQLPASMGRDARLQLARNQQLKPATVEQYQAWTQAATISVDERNQLLKVLSKRVDGQAAR
ncbi:RNA polymerase sigma factor [Phragmitibacter flavus]|nr:sigma-70 family RNA polymerase sigma factor [Phragmitibacter flavus]